MSPSQIDCTNLALVRRNSGAQPLDPPAAERALRSQMFHAVTSLGFWARPCSSPPGIRAHHRPSIKLKRQQSSAGRPPEPTGPGLCRAVRHCTSGQVARAIQLAFPTSWKRVSVFSACSLRNSEASSACLPGPHNSERSAWNIGTPYSVQTSLQEGVHLHFGALKRARSLH